MSSPADPGHEDVEGVILAAGLSSRAGTWKPAWRLGDRTLIEWAVAGMAPAVERILVVGGFRVDDVRRIFKGAPNVEVIFNERYEDGMFTSVIAGLRRTQARRVFLLPGDHPLVSETVYRALLRVTGEVVVPSWGGVRGHPVLLSQEAVRAVLDEREGSTLRAALAHLERKVVEVAEQGVLIDVDTPDDFETACRAYGQHQ